MLKNAIENADVPTSTDNWWSRPVLCQVTMTCSGMQLRIQMYPPVEASAGQDQYYVRSFWHVEECNWEGRCTPPPSTDIWWSRPVLHEVTMTCWGMLCQAIMTCWGMQLRFQIYPHYGHLMVKLSTTSTWHSAECNWVRKQWTWDMSSWTFRNICRLIYLLLLLLLLLLNVVVLVGHLWLWINNYSWTRTTTLHSNNNMNLNKMIALFM